MVALLGRTEGALKLREIADALALDLARVARLAAAGEARLAQDGVFRTKVRQALKNLAGKVKH